MEVKKYLILSFILFIFKTTNHKRNIKKSFHHSKCRLVNLYILKIINMYINDAGLGEHRIRDLNDEINKLLREKFHWEERIRELGGADYRKLNSKIVDSQGIELPGSGGYKYFGAAKDLPGVRELFQKEVPQAPSKNRIDLYKIITYDYYGHLENENNFMVDEEKLWEDKYKKDEMSKWRENNMSLLKNRFKGRNLDEITVQEYNQIINENDYPKDFEIEEVESKPNKDENIENKKEDELRKRKNEILKKYFNESLTQEDGEEKIIKDLIEMNEEL